MTMQSDKLKSRRRVNKLLVGTGTFGAAGLTHQSWVKPTINAVMLPAHAATTDDKCQRPRSRTNSQSYCQPDGQSDTGSGTHTRARANTGANTCTGTHTRTRANTGANTRTGTHASARANGQSIAAT